MSVLCPLCTGQSSLLYEIDHGSKAGFPIFGCRVCQFQFRFPFPSQEEIESYYMQGYYEGTADYTYQDERHFLKYYRHVWKSRLKTIAKNLHTQSSKKIFVDIGSSFGGFAQTAHELGYESFGVEISEYARSESHKYSPQVIVVKHLDDLPLKPASVDVITMVEVIEHIAQPMQLLETLVTLLKPGGILLIQTANMASRQAVKAGKNYHYYLPGHLSYFNKKHFYMIKDQFKLHKIKVFQPVDFSLLAKLKKLRKEYKGVFSLGYITQMFKTSGYHFLSYLHTTKYAHTASMVVYLIK